MDKNLKSTALHLKVRTTGDDPVRPAALGNMTGGNVTCDSSWPNCRVALLTRTPLYQAWRTIVPVAFQSTATIHSEHNSSLLHYLLVISSTTNPCPIILLCTRTHMEAQHTSSTNYHVFSSCFECCLRTYQSCCRCMMRSVQCSMSWRVATSST